MYPSELHAFPLHLAPYSHVFIRCRHKLEINIPTISLLLVDEQTGPDAEVDENSGLMMELRGAAVELRTCAVDMVLTVHLQSLNLEDRVRPINSDFRYC